MKPPIQTINRNTNSQHTYVGIDENGLGPVVGPLIITGVALESSHPRPVSLGANVGDSKQFVSHANASLGEAWTRAILSVLGKAPANPSEIITQVSLDAESTLRELCPQPTASKETPSSMCWPVRQEPFWATQDQVNSCIEQIQIWEKSEFYISSIRSVFVCSARLNKALTQNENKLSVDLHAMERLILAFHRSSNRALDVICGKVGGIGFYPKYFGPLSGLPYTIEIESRAESAYRFAGLGRVSFLRDADEHDPLVGLASLIGKYIRELWMHRIVTYFQIEQRSRSEFKNDPSFANASGYHDPITQKFILETERLRHTLGVPQTCFLREK